MPPRTERVCLGLLVALSLAYHIATLSGQSLFVDEVSELQHTRRPFTEAVFFADSMPPTFTLLVRAWVAALGEGHGVRWLSVGFSLLAIAPIWRVGRRIGSACGADPAACGIATAAVFSALPLQLYYAQLIRGYALMNLAAALSIWAFLNATEKDTPSGWFRFAATGVLGMWCHYYFAVLLLVLLAGLIWRRGWRIGRGPAWAAAFIVIGALPLLPFLRVDFGFQRDLREARPLTAAAAAYTGLSMFSGYSLGPSKNELHEIGAAEAARQAAPWAATLTLATLPLLRLGGLRLRCGGWLGPVALWTFGPVAVVGLLGWGTGITYNPRFVAWCVAPLAIWIGAGLTEGFARGGRERLLTAACGALLAGICGIAIAQRHALDQYRTEDLAGATQWLASHAGADQPVLVIADYCAPQIAYHAELMGIEPLEFIELPRRGVRDLVVSDEALLREGLETLAGATRERAFWLLECRAFHTDPQRILRDAIRNAATLEEAVTFPGVTIYRGRMR